jgi:hypothetical protein
MPVSDVGSTGNGNRQSVLYLIDKFEIGNSKIKWADWPRIGQESGKQRIVPMIIRFITDQKLQVGTSPDMQSRPTGFSGEDTQDQMILVKQ